MGDEERSVARMISVIVLRGSNALRDRKCENLVSLALGETSRKLKAEKR